MEQKKQRRFFKDKIKINQFKKKIKHILIFKTNNSSHEFKANPRFEC
jgi:hypothetical protein